MTVLVYKSRFCSGFPLNFLFLLHRHGFSDRFVNTVHNSNPRFGLIFKQRLNLNFNTVSSVFIAFFVSENGPNRTLLWIHPFTRVPLLDLEATKILGIKIHLLFLLVMEEHRRIVQLRLISKLLRSIVWKTSGLLIISQIVARILATSFSVALHWLAFLREEVV